MPRYVLTYLGGNKPATSEEGKQNYADYQTWLTSLGDAAISPANPLKDTRTIHPDGRVSTGSNIQMSGYTILKADNMDHALSLVTTCPFLKTGGTLELSELMPMP